ncbi:MAG: hypothetical protein D6761_10800 [Candidatus Dadabacteria bacterium]|nr:MAG: hypothetical protein D6761_10800 [Candidatus Dadabacteria bacterium]
MRLFLLIPTAIAAVFWLLGSDYYLSGDRHAHPAHDLLQPGGQFGHLIGYVGTAILMTNFLYYIRKRVRWWPLPGSVAAWLDFHVFVGLTGSSLVLFHSAFLVNNTVATTSLFCLAMLAVTGIIGRYVHGQTPADLAAWRAAANLLSSELRRALPPAEWAAVQQFAEELGRTIRPARSPAQAAMTLLSGPVEALRLEYRIRVQARHWPAHQRPIRQWLKLQTLITRGERRVLAYRRILPEWRRIHRALALLMVLTMLVHVAVITWIGYV